MTQAEEMPQQFRALAHLTEDLGSINWYGIIELVKIKLKLNKAIQCSATYKIVRPSIIKKTAIDSKTVPRSETQIAKQ